uniref:Uncharacterized protein n=1 Tax=Strongyloides papillosus TaxID=174720 RepID=A0A0N5B4S6_STREA
MIKFEYYFILLIQLPLSLPVVLVSTPFDNFRIECPQRHGVQRLNIRMAESQGYKRTDAVFSISCGNIQELSPWDTIPDAISDMEYESCHYTEGFDPILEKHKNITCGARKYLSGITRISGTKTSLMCCKLRTRDVSKCEEKEFEKPLGSGRFVEIQYEGMLINNININNDVYSVRFCSFMPRAVGFIYDEAATSTLSPTTSQKPTTTTPITQTMMDNLMSNKYTYESSFPKLITPHELKMIDNKKNNLLFNNHFNNVQIINEKNIEPMKNVNENVENQEFVATKIGFENKNTYSILGNVSDDEKKIAKSTKPSKIDLIDSKDNQYTKSILPLLELPHEEHPKSSSNNHQQKQKLEIINIGSVNEMNDSEPEKVNVSIDKSTIVANTRQNTISRIEVNKNLPIIEASKQPSFNSHYKNIQTSPIVIEEEIISGDSDDLKTSKSSERKELHSNSFENIANTVYTSKSTEKLPHPSPLPIPFSGFSEQSSTTDVLSGEKVDIARATVAKLHYSLKYNKKYNHTRSALGSKTFIGSDDSMMKDEIQENVTPNIGNLVSTTTRYTTTQYVPRKNRKSKIESTIKSTESTTKQPLKYGTTKLIKQDIIKDDNIINALTSRNEIRPEFPQSTKKVYTSKELNEMEKNSNLMISKVDEFAQIPFDETFEPKDYHSSSENKYIPAKEPIQQAIDEQYKLNGYSPKNYSTKVTYYQPPVPQGRLKPSSALHYNGDNDTNEYVEERSMSSNKGPLIDEDLDNSPFDDPISESLLLSQQDMKQSNIRQNQELDSPQGIDRDFLPRNYLPSHDIRRAPQKTYLENSYHPKSLKTIEKIQTTLPPLTIFKHGHKENSMELQPLTVIKNDDIKKMENFEDTLTTTILNSEFLVRDNNVNSQRIDNNLYIPLTTEEPKILPTQTPITTPTTKYNENIFYRVPKIKIPRKKEKYLTFCTKEDAVRDENNLVIACGGDYDVWIPPRCPQGSSCFLTSDSTYRICCPVSSG